jgi:hypothetical protein
VDEVDVDAVGTEAGEGGGVGVGCGDEMCEVAGAAEPEG